MTDNLADLAQIEAAFKDITTKLKKIVEHKSTVSPGVYEKVKREYEAKLKKIEGELAKNVDLVKKEIDRLKNEQISLNEEEKSVRLNIEEIELRYSIGEYDEEKYKNLKGENQKNLTEITDKLSELAEAIERLQGFITIKDIEKELPVKEPEVIKIEEHILEEKTPEVTKLNDLIIEEAAVKPSSEEKPPTTEEAGVPCPKCGKINPPDSWYCEKCGAEILGSPQG